MTKTCLVPYARNRKSRSSSVRMQAELCIAGPLIDELYGEQGLYDPN
jgi:hypothetical protein